MASIDVMSTNLNAGESVALSESVLRVVADNGNAMTGPGTNTYIIGTDDLAVIDPGPLSERHCEAILKAAEPRGEIKYVLLTHTHSDHSPGTDLLVEKTGAKTALYPNPSGKPFQDVPVKADYPLLHNDFLSDVTPNIQAVHTPGHASNHLCFYLPDEKMLFTGDHLMNGSTVVIASPDGNMTEYIDSLKLLNEYDIEFLCPGHGSVMTDPKSVVEHTIKHRLGREEKVLAAVNETKSGDINKVLKIAYADTPEFLHGLAMMSLTAHLEKLEREGSVKRSGELWLSL